MAIDFVCGWECRSAIAGAAATPDELHWDSAAAAGGSISTSTFRTGTAAFRNNCAANTANFNKAISRTIVSGRFYFRIATAPGAAETPHIINFANASGNLLLRVTTTGQLVAIAGAGSPVNVGSPMSTNTWYRIDFLANSSGGTASIKARIDGGTEGESTNVQASVSMTTMRVGVFTNATCDFFFDDLIIGDATSDYPFGVGYVERMKPSRDGTHIFTAADFGENTAGADVSTSATNVNTFVDDDDMTSTADLIRQKAIRTAGYLEVGFGTPPRWYPAQAVNVISSWHAATTTADTMGMKLVDGASIKNVTDEAGDGLTDVSQTSIIILEKILTTAPSGGEWTSTKLAAVLIRAGYSDDVTPNPYWDGVMLEVAYGPEQPILRVNPYIQLLPH